LDGNSEWGDAGSRDMFDAGGIDRDGPFVAYFLVKSFVEGCFILWGLGRFVIASFREGLEVHEAIGFQEGGEGVGDAVVDDVLEGWPVLVVAQKRFQDVCRFELGSVG
jgi:hypothetical protein